MCGGIVELVHDLLALLDGSCAVKAHKRVPVGSTYHLEHIQCLIVQDYAQERDSVKEARRTFR